MFCLNKFFMLTNSVNPDELQHYAAFHLGLHCLKETTRLGVFRIQRVKNHVLLNCIDEENNNSDSR